MQRLYPLIGFKVMKERGSQDSQRPKVHAHAVKIEERIINTAINTWNYSSEHKILTLLSVLQFEK